MSGQLTGKTLKGFYALEGIDGAGKTTLLNALKEKCQKEGTDSVLLFHAEPTNELTGLACRALLDDKSCPISYPPSFRAYVFAADRYNHLYAKNTGVLALIEQGKMVITDRYIYSSVAYQTCMDDYREDFSQRKYLAAHVNRGFELPEKVFFLKCPPALALERQKKRAKEPIDDLDRLMWLDTQYKSIFEREKAMYKWAEQDYPTRHINMPLIVTLDASKDVEDLVSIMYMEIFS